MKHYRDKVIYTTVEKSVCAMSVEELNLFLQLFYKV